MGSRDLLTKIFFIFFIFGMVGLIRPGRIFATDYYFDSAGGRDSNAGNTESSPWQSLSKLNSTSFQAGDTANFKSGSVWSGGLVISKSGSNGNPITFKPYGVGNKPVFENPSNSSETDAVKITGSYIVLDGVLTRNAVYSGIKIEKDAKYVTVKNIEATNVGIGIAINGANNTITNNFIHDLKMVVNDQGGGGNDYGAVGIEIFNGPNEVSYNRLVKCIAPSYDFGTDGGALEIYLIYGNADGSTFHHNYAEETDGFIEVHSRDKQFSVNNVTISQNVMVDLRALFDIGMPGYGGGHAVSSVNNLKIEQNTYVARENSTQGDQLSVFYFHEMTPTAAQILIRNNIIYSMNSWAVAPGNSNGAFTHKNNIYYISSSRSPGFNLDLTEKRVDPQFVNLSGKDFKLKSTSPAINAGVNLGYALDFENHVIPAGNLPDIGAYEYNSTPTAISPTNSQSTPGGDFPSTTPSGVFPGDANSDGTVDGVDYVIWLNNYNKNVTGESAGDFDRNGFVDGVDYVVWLNNYGK